MNKQNAKLASWAAVLTAVLVLFTLFYMFRREGRAPGIELPLDPNELSEVNSPVDEIAPAGALALELIGITRENAETLIANMPRPDNYSGAGVTTVYGGGRSRKWLHHFYVMNGYQSIEQYQDDVLIDKIIYSPDTVYMWLNEQVMEIVRGAFSPDAAVRMPTHEDILEISAEDIIDVEYIRDIDASHVRIRAHILSMEVEYFIDLESGLLTEAIARQDGKIAWEFELFEFTIERPDDEMFLLPSGAYVWE